MNKSESIIKLSQALLKAQKAMGAATKDSSNPFFKSKYADYGAVLEVAKAPLNDNGVLLLQPHVNEPTQHYVETILIHSDSGEFMSSYTPVICSKPNDPQALGSAITYARRYGLQSFLSLPTEDDDGNAGSGKGYTHPKATPTPKAPETPKVNSNQLIKEVVEEINVVTSASKAATPKKETPKAQPAVAAKVQAGW